MSDGARELEDSDMFSDFLRKVIATQANEACDPKAGGFKSPRWAGKTREEVAENMARVASVDL